MFLKISLVAICIFFTVFSYAQPVGVTQKQQEIKPYISLRKYNFSTDENITVAISLVNKSKSVQKILFDKPKSGTGGTFSTSVKITNVKTGQSVLKYENKAILNSQIYSLEQLKNCYYVLKPGEIIIRTFKLSDLVVFNNSGIGKGEYTMQLFYDNNASNKLSFTIE